MPGSADIAVTYPAELPIVGQRDVIMRALAGHPVIVVCGETGSGKSTQLPKICLEAGRGTAGRIGLTQPRRIAARTIAGRLADELQTTLGDAVGFKVRFTDRTGPNARIKVMTDGILLAETQGDRTLAEYDTIIIDEAHERSLNIDFLLGYMKRLSARRPELKIIISSATIDPQRFSSHFGGAPILQVEGRVHPVEVRYRPPDRGELDEAEPSMLQAILGAVDEAIREGPGDVLVFLSGEREIRATARVLRGRHHDRLQVLPLYARLPAAEQQRVFEPAAQRRVVLATNVAETSLTVPGIRFVVDPGLARLSRYSARSRIQRLPIERISQASARQRAGRCGRLGPGTCLRLYKEEDFDRREAYTPAEILRSNLAGVILRMKALGLGNVREFPFLDPPPRGMIADGENTLRELGALDERDRLTDLGRRLARLPVDPRLGRMILGAAEEGCLREVLTITAALSVQDPRERPHAAAGAADEAHRRFASPKSDFLTLLALWHQYHEQREHHPWSRVRAWCHDHFVSFVCMREWADVRRQLAQLVREQGGGRVNREPAGDDAIHRAVLTGLLGQVGSKRPDRAFAGPRSTRFYVHPGSVLFQKPPAWVMAAEIVDTTKRYARTVAPVQPSWIERLGAHLVKRSHSEPYWDARSGRVMAFERVTLHGLELVARRRVPYGPIDPTAARSVFIAEALVEGRYRSRGAFAEHNRRLARSIHRIEAKRRRRDLLDDARARFDFYDRRLPAGISTGRAFERWRHKAERDQPALLHMQPEDLLREGAEPLAPEGFPDDMPLGEATVPLDYRFEPGAEEDGVTLTIPLAQIEQVPAERLEWGVPGQLHERVTAMLRSLPKALRRQFVPAPDWARDVAERLSFGRGRLAQSVADVLHELSGVAVPPEAFALDALPEHLRMRARVVDANGTELATGRDLDALRAALRPKARAQFNRLAGAQFEREGVVAWDFGDLPLSVDLPGGLTAWPAVVDRGASVALRALPTPDAAAAAHRRGVRRLYLIELGAELREMLNWVPGLAELERLHAPLGTDAELHDALLGLTVEHALLAGREAPRTEQAFRAALNAARDDLWTHAEVVCGLVERILQVLAEVRTRLRTLDKPVFTEAVARVRAHLDELLGPGVLGRTPLERLEHFPRYVRAIGRRLERLPGGLERDSERERTMQPLLEQHAARRAEHEERDVHDPELEQFRWMLEEMRVSLWAQELGTAVPVSEKRLAEQWSRVRP